LDLDPFQSTHCLTLNLPHEPIAFLKPYKRHNFSVYTGERDFKDRGQLLKFNGQDKFPLFKESCNKVMGAVDFFRPGLKAGKNVTLFLDRLERPAVLDYVKEVYFEGLKTYMYTLNRSLFIQSEDNCYRQPNLEQGIYTLSVVDEHITIYLYFSQPHFLEGNKSLHTRFGMTPDSDLHQTYFLIEPNTGLPVSFVARLQANLMVDSNSIYPNIVETFVPLFWIEKEFTLHGSALTGLKMLANSREILIGVGCSLMLCGLTGIIGLTVLHFKLENTRTTDHNTGEKTNPTTKKKRIGKRPSKI